MKKMNRLSWLFLAGLMAVFTFTACSNADDDEPIDNGGGVVAPAGDGTEANPYNVAAAIAQNNSGAEAWVKGYIVGQVAGSKLADQAEFSAPFHGATNDDGTVAEMGTNLLLAADKNETDTKKCIVVQLPYGDIRTTLELVKNPGNDGKELAIKGKLIKYFGSFGLKECTTAVFEGKTIGEAGGGSGDVTGDGTQAKPYNIAGIFANQGATAKFAKGYIVGHLKGTTVGEGAIFDKAEFATDNNILIADKADEKDIANCAVVTVAADFRSLLGLKTNPDNLGKEVLIQGDFASAYGGKGIKPINYAKLGDKEAGTIINGSTDNSFDVPELSIANLRAKYSGEGTLKVTDKQKIVGIVISDKEGGNSTSKKTLVIATPDNSSGIAVMFAADHPFALGEKVEVLVENASLGNYGKLVQLTGVALNRAQSIGKDITVTPLETTISAINANPTTFESRLVTVKGTITSKSAVEGKYGNKDSHTNNVIEKDGSSMTLFVTKYAAFIDQSVPAGEKTVTGIAGRYNDDLQISMRNINDVK